MSGSGNSASDPARLAWGDICIHAPCVANEHPPGEPARVAEEDDRAEALRAAGDMPPRPGVFDTNIALDMPTRLVEFERRLAALEAERRPAIPWGGRDPARYGI